MGNWISSQIVQLDQMVHPTVPMQALSEIILALSKHFVNRIDSTWAAGQQTAYYSILSTTP